MEKTYIQKEYKEDTIKTYKRKKHICKENIYKKEIYIQKKYRKNTKKTNL